MQEKCQNCFQSVTTPPERADNENGSLHCVAFEDIAKGVAQVRSVYSLLGSEVKSLSSHPARGEGLLISPPLN